MRFNDEKILEDADMSDICAQLGIKMVRRGSNTFISCPEHIMRTGREDRKCNKCCIKKGYYHCFSCGASGNVIRLAQVTLGCSGYEARQQICEMLGGAAMYADTEYKPMDIMPYTWKEFEALGLYMTTYGDIPRCIAESSEEIEKSRLFEAAGSREYCLFLNNNGCMSITKSCKETDYPVISPLYVGYKKVSANIRSLYAEDKESFFWLVANKAAEMWQKYEYLLENDIAGKILPEKTAYYVNYIYRTNLEICKRIYKELEYTKNKCMRKKCCVN